MIAAVYARKSTDQSGVADAEKSVTRQIEHASDYAVGKGWTVAPEHVYSDDGISGAEFDNRPGFLRLMNALKPKAPFQVLIMSEESRLGREAIETAYALKQLVTGGVRVFFYLEDRERTLDSPTDKIMLSLTTFADELEREKARQRTHDAMLRKARAGHVTGGRVFGYDNVRVNGHVERRINETESEVVRRIFGLSANGHGMKAIAKRLNAEGDPSPRAQQGRSQSWAPSSVRTVLFRDLYRGVITWNQTRKRNQWGQKQQTRRPEDEWVRIPAPHLMIVTDEVWEAAHARLDAARAVYLKGTSGQRFGRPPIGSASKYLLTNLAQCGCCGSSLKVRTRSHRHFRAKFYGCSGYHDRGRTICANGVDIPMEDANGIVLEALLDDVLTPDVLDESVEHALQILMGGEKQSEADRRRLEQQMRRVEGERGHCQLDQPNAFSRLDAAVTCARSAGAGHRVPFDERPCSKQAVMSRAQQVSADPKQILYGTMHRQEALRVSDRLESAHLALALPRRLMRHLRSVVLVLLRAVYDRWHHGAVRRRVAPQLVRDQTARQPALSLQHPAEESYGRSAIASRLDEDVEEVAVLVDGPPEISALPLNRCEDFVQIPRVAQAATAAP